MDNTPSNRDENTQGGKDMTNVKQEIRNDPRFLEEL